MKAETKPTRQVQTNHWGIDLDYKDALGTWHQVPPETLDAILAVMKPKNREESRPQPPVVILRQGDAYRAAASGRIQLESGEWMPVAKQLPVDLPLGYHRLEVETSGQTSRLIVTPRKCYLPNQLRTWGWAVQLYAARSKKSWGIGDFADLENLAAWSKTLGAGMLLLNPLSAAAPILPQQGSPYYPTSRRFFNALWLCVQRVPGARDLTNLAALERAGQALNEQRLIDRDAIFKLKMEALGKIWNSFKPNEQFDSFCREQGPDLERFAVFCALAEKYQGGWHCWPEQLRHPENPAVNTFAEANQPRIRFHQWLQWLIDLQLGECAKQLPLMQDLPIGVDPDGADAWAWQDIFAKGMAVGAPPDEFNTQGQNWGLPPFDPHKLRAAAYEPFIQTIRAAFRNGGGLRIDHVMGLFRLFWIPDGRSAHDGAYVRYPADDLLAIVALESERAQAYVVGEDLGTVETEVRKKLESYRVLSYRLLWFEKEEPEAYPHDALAAITTHDLPTVAGLWTGSDLRKQQELGLHPNEESTAEIQTRLARLTGVERETPIDSVIGKSYDVLSRAPSRILTAALDDAAAVEERPNVPATLSDKNPNWSLALPLDLESLIRSPLAEQIAKALNRSA